MMTSVKRLVVDERVSALLELIFSSHSPFHKLRPKAVLNLSRNSQIDKVVAINVARIAKNEHPLNECILQYFCIVFRFKYLNIFYIERHLLEMQNEDMKSCSLRNVEASSVHQDCIYLIKNNCKIL